MDQDLDKRLTVLEQKIDATYVVANKTRKIFLWTLIIAVVTTILPLIGLLFAVPKLIESLGVYKDLGL
jgi:hypothetical protein